VSRWFRFYAGVVDDPKAQMLSPELFKHWVNVLCIAAQHDGELPSIGVTAFTLGRMQEAKAAGILSKLHALGLLDKTDKSFKPHNWDRRQYKHDGSDPTNADRQKRFRNSKRNGSNGESNGTDTVTVKRPDSTETDTEARASDVRSPVDHRKRLFSEGLEAVRRLSGKGPDASRSFIAKCLKAAEDNAVTVLGLIEDAERNEVIDPCAWIVARLKPAENFNGKAKSGIIQAADDLRRKVASFDGPANAGDDLRDGTRTLATRLLSHG